MKLCVLICALCCLSLSSFAQDTFYVKKKTETPQVAEKIRRPDSENDSIISYTCEYMKPGTNTWVVLHLLGPHLVVPSEAYTEDGGTRVWFRDIIARDMNGDIYRQQDRMWKSGVWTMLDTSSK